MIQNLTEDQIALQIIKLLREAKKKEFSTLLDELHPYDIAKIFQNLPEKHKNRFLTFIETELLVLLMAELEQEDQLDILNRLGFEKTGIILNEMDNDDIASLLDELSPETISSLLSSMKQEDSSFVQTMMNYESETAGRLMTNRFVWIRNNYLVQDAIDKLKTFAEYAETLQYLYVIDKDDCLVGVVSYRDLLIAGPKEKIAKIMYERVISVNVHTDQEEVAQLIERYDFLAIPVVDDNKKLVGIITVDDIIDVFIQEAKEDFDKLSATGGEIDFETSPLVAARKRLPWLILLLFMGLFSGSILDQFGSTIEKVVALTFFIPMIAGMTGNTGTQSLALVVRGLVSNELNRKQIIHLILREFNVGILIGFICSLVIFGMAWIWKGIILAIVVSSSLFFTLIIGTLAGTIIPLILYRMKVDPAIASGPLISTLNDIFSLITYFGIATLFLQYLI